MVEAPKAFVFPGQGRETQRFIPEMADTLLSSDNPDIGDLIDLAYQEAVDVLGPRYSNLHSEDVGKVHRPGFTEPAILTLSIAALRALNYYDIKPQVVAGHSMGEFSALVAAESLSFEQALRLVQRRGEFMKEAGDSEAGTMAAVIGLTREEVETVCKESGAELANHNSPKQIVISGGVDSITYATKVIRDQGGRVLDIEVSIAAHSSLMKSAQERMAILLEHEIISDPKVQFVQNTTGEYAENSAQIRRGLIDQLTGSVLWVDTIRRMSIDGVEYIEVGPGTVLSRLINRIESGATVEHATDVILKKDEERKAKSTHE